MSKVTLCLLVLMGVASLNAFPGYMHDHYGSYDSPDYAVVRGSGGRSRLVKLGDRPDYNLAFVQGSNGKSKLVKVYDRPDPADKVLLPVGSGKNKRYMVADRDQLYDSHMYHGLGGRHGAYIHGRKKRHAFLGIRRFPFFSPMFPHPAVAMALQAHRANAFYQGARFGRRFGVSSAKRTVKPRKVEAKPASPVQKAAPAPKAAPVAPAPAAPTGYPQPMSQIVDNYGSLSSGPDTYLGSSIDTHGGIHDYNDPNSFVYQDNTVGGLDLGTNVDYQGFGSNNLGGNVYDSYDIQGIGNINTAAGTGNLDTYTGPGNINTYNGNANINTYNGVNPNDVYADVPATNDIYSNTVGGAYDYQNNGNILTSGVNVYANDISNTMYDTQGNIAFNAGGNPGSNLGSIVNVDAGPTGSNSLLF